jgi:DNA replication and repair protein RecF
LKLKSLTVDRFRNLENQELAFDTPVTQLYGANAQGKTNLLEGIYVLGTTRSFREQRTERLVRENCEQALLRGKVECYGVGHELGMELRRGGKRYLKDGAEVPLSGYLGLFPTVALSTEDRRLIAGQPRYRRQFLDAAALWRRPAYLETLLGFGRCHQQKTLILRGYRPDQKRELAAWDSTFAKLGTEIQRERETLTQEIRKRLVRESRELGFDEAVEFTYRPSGGEDLGAALEKVRGEEIRRGICLVGPQRDDVQLLLDGRPAEAFGSAGQQRTLLWLLKLALVNLIAEETGEPPVLLLDDAESELDERRFRRLMAVTGERAQVVMTASRELPLEWTGAARYRVEAGRVSREI